MSIHGRVPGLEQASFEQVVERAAGLCPVSNALRGNVEISVSSELEQ